MQFTTFTLVTNRSYVPKFVEFETVVLEKKLRMLTFQYKNINYDQVNPGVKGREFLNFSRGLNTHH